MKSRSKPLPLNTDPPDSIILLNRLERDATNIDRITDGGIEFQRPTTTDYRRGERTVRMCLSWVLDPIAVDGDLYDHCVEQIREVCQQLQEMGVRIAVEGATRKGGGS